MSDEYTEEYASPEKAVALLRRLARGRKVCIHAAQSALPTEGKGRDEVSACVDVTLKAAAEFINTAYFRGWPVREPYPVFVRFSYSASRPNGILFIGGN